MYSIKQKILAKNTVAQSNAKCSNSMLPMHTHFMIHTLW